MKVSSLARSVLTVVPDFPLPAETGLHLRMMSNLDLVHRLGCDSHLLYFSTEGRAHNPGNARLWELCASVTHAGPRKEQDAFSAWTLIQHKIDFLVRGGLGRPSHRYPYSMRWDAVEAEKLILAHARAVKASFVLLPTFMAHYAPRLRRDGFTVIGDAADVLSEVAWRFRRYGATARGGRMGLYANWLACRAQEQLFLPHFREIWATSRSEAASLRAIVASVPIIPVASSFASPELRVTDLPPASTIGFIAKYSYEPNAEAAMFLARDVFPLVLREVHTARLLLAGADMPAAATQSLSQMKNVDLLGRVADSGTLFENTTIFALPLFARGGVPLKLIEAMARGRPVVASPEALEGLDVRDGRECLIASSAAEFASAIVRLLQDPGLARTLARNGRHFFEEYWSREAAERMLRETSVLCRE